MSPIMRMTADLPYTPAFECMLFFQTFACRG